MAKFDPDTNPRGFLTAVVAGGLYVFNVTTEKYVDGDLSRETRRVMSVEEAFDKAELFIAEIERRYGEIKP